MFIYSAIKSDKTAVANTFWFHLLRGGAASILSSEDISTPKIDKWLGHSISGIAGKYIKIGDSDLDSIAKVMARLLKPVWK